MCWDYGDGYQSNDVDTIRYISEGGKKKKKKQSHITLTKIIQWVSSGLGILRSI